MSERTPCNFCTLEMIRTNHIGKKIELKPGKGMCFDKNRPTQLDFWPRKIVGMKIIPGIDVFVDDEWVAWFMELTDHCVC